MQAPCKSAAHTPGPWAAVETFDDEGASLGLRIDSPDGTVCTMPGIGAQDFDDAAAIAAAPELLKALKACMFALGRAGANTAGGPGRTEWEQARAAIVKATGSEA